MLRRGLAMVLSIVGLVLPWSAVLAGTIVSPHTYAWSNNVGYINFAQVVVDDSGLTGWAWSTNKGYIVFDPAQGGVTNDGNGNLSGSAWGEQLGWIDFSNVGIDSDGQFFGSATGDLIDTLTFDCPTYCDVATDWRPATSVATPLVDDSPNAESEPEPEPESVVEPTPEQSAEAELIDIQQDGIIDIFDFNLLMVSWDATTCGSQVDVDDDCTVGLFDFNTLMVYWGITYQL